MDSRNVSLALVVLGMVCLPAPLYLGGAGGATDGGDRTSLVYAVEPVDPSNPNDTDAVIDAYGDGLLLSVHEVSAQQSPGTYRAPQETRVMLKFAMKVDHAKTSNPAVQADLRQIERRYTFVHDATDETDRYYEVFVRSNGTVVQMLNATERQVLDATIEATVVDYGDLQPREQRTFRRILRESTDDDGVRGYRPYEGVTLLDRLPTLVRYDGRLYDVRPVDRVEAADSGGGTAVNPYAVSLVGTLLVAAGLALDRSGENDGE